MCNSLTSVLIGVDEDGVVNGQVSSSRSMKVEEGLPLWVGCSFGAYSFLCCTGPSSEGGTDFGSLCDRFSLPFVGKSAVRVGHHDSPQRLIEVNFTKSEGWAVHAEGVASADFPAWWCGSSSCAAGDNESPVAVSLAIHTPFENRDSCDMWEEGGFNLPDLTGTAHAVRLPHNHCNSLMDRCLRYGAGFVFAQHFDSGFDLFGWRVGNVCLEQDSVLCLYQGVRVVRNFVEESPHLLPFWPWGILISSFQACLHSES